MDALTPAQQAAYDQLLPFLQGRHEAHLAVLEGFAGSGKTTLVSRLLRALPGLKIAVAAPTNKAVRVLRDQLAEAGVAIAEAGDLDWAERRQAQGQGQGHSPVEGCTCRSIHSLLGLKLRETDDGQQKFTADGSSTLRDYDVVVVDECSMLNDRLFQKVVMERGRAQILFVGDPAQLPPVKEASISPVFNRVNMKVRLAEVVRQARENPIIRLSMRLRELIEAGVKASALDLLEVLPDLSTSPKAALVREPATKLVDWLLTQDGDTRIIAYTNDRVQWYNQAVHQARYGDTDTRFVAGERVIVHTQCEAQRLTPGALRISEPDRLITSEELQVEEVEIAPHPLFPEIPNVEKLTLRGDTGYQYVVFVTQNEVFLERQITEGFARMKTLRFQAARADAQERRDLQNEAMEARDRASGLKKAFAKLRHAYAITCHKSQGSTFDCALVDFTDLARMPDAFQFNRALYVAVTRSREYLALVVT